jgi:hypothetical protein
MAMDNTQFPCHMSAPPSLNPSYSPNMSASCDWPLQDAPILMTEVQGGDVHSHSESNFHENNTDSHQFENVDLSSSWMSDMGMESGVHGSGAV